VASWVYNFEATLGFLGCTHLSYYNFDDDLETKPDGLAAINQLMASRS
jgi:hypothetical protein